MNYLVIELKARKCNLLQSLAVFSPAPVFAANMAVHALDKRLEKKGLTLGVTGLGLVHNDATIWEESMEATTGYLQAAEPVWQRGAAAFDISGATKKPQGNSIQPQLLGDIEWTLIIQHEVSADGRKERIRNELLNMRFAGGVIDEAFIQCATDSLQDALRAVRRGYWIDDVTDRLEGEGEAVEKLLAATRSDSWVVPVNLGYALLEAPGERIGSRDGCAHAFAEHMIGLVKLTSIHQVRDEIQSSRFWRYGWIEDQFLVTNRPELVLQNSPSIS